MGTSLALIAFLSCSENSVTGTDGVTTDDLALDEARIATVVVNFSSPSIGVGDTTRAIATLRNRSDGPVSRTVSWSSSNPRVATVDPSGLVTGTGNGTTAISASTGAIMASGSMTVGPMAAAAVSNPGSVTDLAVASTDSTSITLTFTQVDDGTGQPASYDVRWQLAPISWGSARSATNGSCRTPLSGTAVGTALTCTVAGLTPLKNYQFQLVSFRGTLNQNAVFGGLSNVASGTTTTSANPPPPPVPVATVTVTPATASIQTSATVQLTATTKDANGNVLTGRSITWSSSNTSVATVSSSGLVSGVAAGSATITATSEGKTGSSAITVTAPQQTTNPGTVTNLGFVSVDSASVVLSFTQVNDGTGNPANYNVRYAKSPIAWGSASAVANGTCKTPLVGTGIGTTLTCSALGLVPSTKYDFQLVAYRGTLNQNAVFGSLSNILTVTTLASSNPPPPPVAVATVAVTPASSTIQVGGTVQLTATTKDANGNTLSGRTITWSSANPSVATVNGSGLVTGAASGSTQITATSEGKSGSAGVTVQSAPPPPPPPDGTLLFQENFEDSNIGSRGWYDNTTVSLSTTEHISGSTASAQYHWSNGATTPQNGSAQRHKFTPSNSVYLSYYVKYSANYVGSGQDYHPHEFYILSTLDDQYDGLSNNYLDIYVEQNYQNGGRPVIAMQDNRSINYSMGSVPNNLVGATENRSTAGCNGMVESNMYHECFGSGTSYYNLKNVTGPVTFQPTAGSAGYKNNWNFVEAYVQLNTVTNGKANADGVMQYWFNGQLIIDRHDIMFRTGAHATMQLNQFVIAPYIGDGSPADQYMWVDNLRVATSRIP